MSRITASHGAPFVSKDHFHWQALQIWKEPESLKKPWNNLKAIPKFQQFHENQIKIKAIKTSLTASTWIKMMRITIILYTILYVLGTMFKQKEKNQKVLTRTTTTTSSNNNEDNQGSELIDFNWVNFFYWLKKSLHVRLAKEVRHHLRLFCLYSHYNYKYPPPGLIILFQYHFKRNIFLLDSHQSWYMLASI